MSRPEKDHGTQLRAFSLLLRSHPEHAARGVRLVMLGGARNEADHARVASLQALADSLDLTSRVSIHVNASYPDMLSLLSRASAGLHTMVDEHFGISVVELMAAGVVPVAHASAGPLLDIVVPVDGEKTGFLANDDQSFADGMHAVLSTDEGEVLRMRERGRRHAVDAFNEDVFKKTWDQSGWKEWIV
jgi:alpha-1,2-mannosyltransferase